MKVCMVIASLARVGGVESVVRQCADALVDQGCKVTIVTFDAADAAQVSSTDRFEVVTVPSRRFHDYDQRRAGRNASTALSLLRALFSPEAALELAETIAGQGPDVIHTHKIRGMPLGTWSALDRICTAPLVHGCHDVELLLPAMTWSLSPEGMLRRAATRLWQAWHRRATQAVVMSLFPSRFLREAHLEHGFFAKAEARVIPNPVVAALHEPQSQEFRSLGPMRVVYIGRLSPEKGVRELIGAFEDLARTGPVITLRIAGSGTLEESVRSAAGRVETIEYVGFADPELKRELLEWADLVIVPSQCDEGFGLVAAEAIAAGTPVVVSRRGALPELVTENR
ncbi:MAG: glycosyltransferase, partial [Xanthomonadales bacterium]|nr:glycosyltransferase [Xanthomonadales bacterium]